MSRAGTRRAHRSLRGSKEVAESHVASPAVHSRGFGESPASSRGGRRTLQRGRGRCSVRVCLLRSSRSSRCVPALSSSAVNHLLNMAGLPASPNPSAATETRSPQFNVGNQHSWLLLYCNSAAHKHRVIRFYGYCLFFPTGEEHACASIYISDYFLWPLSLLLFKKKKKKLNYTTDVCQRIWSLSKN